MIIKFSKDIILTEWFVSGRVEKIWNRYRKTAGDGDPDVLVSVRLQTRCHSTCYVNFYGELAFLHQHYPSSDFTEHNAIIGDLESAKQQVDNFLIKMSGLTAFL